MSIKYWIKTSLHKDGTPQWDGVIGIDAVNAKISDLRKRGYHPIIDHKMTEVI